MEVMNGENHWHTSSMGAVPQFFVMTFNSKVKVKGFTMKNAKGTIYNIRNFELQCSNDGMNYISVGSYVQPNGGGAEKSYKVNYDYNGNSYKYYRVYVTSTYDYYTTIGEMLFDLELDDSGPKEEIKFGDYINLGTNIIDLNATGHKADWRVFDIDETGVYAILSDYLPNTTIPSTMKVSENAGAKQVTISKNSNGWTVGWIESGTGAATDNIEAVATLTTASNWNFLVPSTSPLRGHIIGSPTYQQFAKSWNKVNGSVKAMDEATPTEYSGLKDSTGVYIIADNKNNKMFGNWLASPYAELDISLWGLDYSGRVRSYIAFYGDSYYGLRPIANLTTDINITGPDANGVWHIAQ